MAVRIAMLAPTNYVILGNLFVFIYKHDNSNSFFIKLLQGLNGVKYISHLAHCLVLCKRLANGC